MNLAVHDLLTCCRQLGSDKAMERKKEIEKFKHLICDPETVQQLDRNSDSKHGKQMNWDAVFRFLQKYIQKEAESVRVAKPNAAASTQATRQKKMKQISSLVKYFITCANKRAPRIKCQELLSYVMDTLNESSRYAIYGADCNSILLKDILKVRKYWCEISPQQWSDLQNLYFELFLNPSRDVNKVLVARIIYTLTRGLCFQTDKFSSDILNFFSKVMHRARQERNPAGLDHIFAAINVFLPIYAMNYRMQVCKLGEEILSTVLFIWAQYKPKDFLKEQIIQFVQFQICVHHPNGAKTQEEGAYSSAKWQNTLYNLYDLLANEITLISSRGKYSSGSRSIVLKDNLVELMADSCHQVFTQDTRVLEVTQLYTVTQPEAGDGEGPSKRRRIELGWEVIEEHLQKSQNSFDVIPWLQITTRLVSKYPRSLPDNELTHLLNILYQLLPQQRRGERTPYVLRCLKEVALCQSQKIDLNVTQKLELQRAWSKIWSLVDRSLNLRQTEMESFELLGVIFQRNLITMDKEIWRIFTGSACKPSSFAVQCLASAMTALEIPETSKTGSFQNDWEGNAAYTLKERVMKWLLFCYVEEVMEDSMELPPVLCSDFPKLELQKILVSLTMKNCRAAMAFLHNTSECTQHTQEKEETSLSEIEAFYLQTTFSKIDIFTNMADEVSENKPSSSSLVVSQKLEETLKHDLMMMSEQLLSNVSLETISMEILMRCTSILTGVLGCYCYAGILTEEEACKLDLFQKAKSFFNYVGESISQSKNKLNEDSKIVSLRNLIMQCTNCLCNCTQNSSKKSLSSIFLHLLTSKLMNDLASICKHLMFFTGKSSEAGEVNLMEDFPEESRMEEGNQTVFDPFDDECNEVAEVNEVGDLHTLTGAKSPLSEEHLTKQDLLLLDILKFLCIAITATTVQTVPFRCSEIWRKLLMLIDGNSFDFIKPLHLHVYLVLLKELPRGENPLPEDYVVSLLKLLPEICSFYRRDQEVCSAILRNLLPMINILGTFSTNSEDLREARCQVLTVVGAFWHLANEGKCSVPVRIALLNCMTAFLHADPHSEWAVLTVKCENLPVRDAFPQFLADNNFQVCMIAAKSAISLFQDVKLRDATGLLKGLPLKFQQRAFENLYIKVQEGAKKLLKAHDTRNQESHPDEEHNRKTLLLMLITMILHSSPVCEKQALFAILQCMNKNGLDPQLVKKVLENISDSFGYENIEDLMNTHLDYLVLEWLNCGYSLSVFPYVLLNCPTLEDFYRSCYKVLIPQLIIRDQFEEVKAIASHIETEERQLLAQCFPKILVNILPYFAYQNHEDNEFTQKSNTASKVYDMLQDENCLGKQLIDSLFHGSLSEIVVEVLMTLHEPVNIRPEENSDLINFTGDLDPAPNPPYFPSCVIQATLGYINSCYKTKSKSIIAILSKNPESFQKILFAICEQVSGTRNIYKKHRILMIYHFFVNLLLKEIEDGLGGAWAFVLRDVIYSMIHHISNKPNPLRGVSLRSFLLCCDLLNRVCHTAAQHCKDALASHLHVIVGTLIPVVGEQPETEEEILGLLKYLVIDNLNNEYLYQAIKLLDPFPDHPRFKELRATQQKIKYSTGKFSLLEEINHFLSISISDSLFLTRLEGLNDLHKQLEGHKEQIMELMKKFQENPRDCVIVKLMAYLLQLSKTTVHSADTILEAVGSCLGEIGPISFSTIVLQHSKNGSSSNTCDLFEDRELQWVFVILTLINNFLIDQRIEVRSAAAACLKNILATKTGHTFWEMYKTKTDTMLPYLRPFRTSKKKVLEVPGKIRETPSEDLDRTTLWITHSESHEIWIKTLTCALLDSGMITSEILLLLKPLCKVQVDFCQTVLPYLIHDMLLHDSNESGHSLLSAQVQMFFTSCCKYSLSPSRSSTPANSDPDSEILVHGHLDKISRRTMLAVVDYLRRQKKNPSSTIFDDSFWLELNYLQVAMVAQSCSAHFTALLYAEIYADKIGRQQERSASKATKKLIFEEGSQNSTLTCLSEKSREETGISLQDLLMDIYRSIGEPDSLYGCGGGRMLQPLARIRTYEHEGMWGKALVTYDLETSLPPSIRQTGLVEALQNYGLCNTLSIYLKGLEQENEESSIELQEIRYQAAWRNMHWDQISTVKDEIGQRGYHESLYDALQCLRDRDFSTFYGRLKCARVKEVEELLKGSLESIYSLLPTLCRLQMIGELEYVGQLFSGSQTNSQLHNLDLKWQKQSQLLQDSDFAFQEPIMALRTVILKTLLEKEDEDAQRCIKNILTKHLVELSRLARMANNSQLPERAMYQVKQYSPTRHGVSEWKLEEAQVFWAKKEESLALSILKDMIKKLDENWFEVEKDPHLKLIYTECLRLCGSWLAETFLENPTIIMQDYLEKAVKIAGDQSDDSTDELKRGKMKAFLSLARFSDTEYQRIEDRMKSSEFENKRALLKKAKYEVGLLREHKVQTSRYTVKVQRELEIDECEIRALGEDRKRFLCKAVENYIMCLLSGEEHDMWIFRLCSLWLENAGLSEINAMIQKEAKKIPSYKFLPLMYQLAARMGTKMTGFHEILNNLIARISLDHPHHTLFIILALANANKDEPLTKPEVTERSRLIKNVPKEASPLDMDRMAAASSIINIVKCKRPDMVVQVEALCDAYITLANMDASPWKSHRRGINIPSNQPITKLKNLDDVAVPTMEIKVDPSGKYENLITIKSFKPQFHLAGGVNLPKIIDCVGSDGQQRRQLVKGRDDLRQDAVMQQVFQMCNTLLQQDAETRKRKLTIRRYKVVPLSQRSGILEWCTGTIPLGEFLINTHCSAHKRYRPNDYSSIDCQTRMMDAKKKSFEEKYTIFMDICQNFQPVFRYFFMERFLDPAVWFEKRLAYTRSVATSSIVGYILGLGDRHVQNILLDEESAELVHIDLGVAFEQGKILPTPETVPFRLTRDIVDGMGIAGVEGVFRRCCEKTMNVMRNSQEALLTIVEVLLYDPLFDWTMNPLKALYLQQRSEDEADVSSAFSSADQGCNKKANNENQLFNKVAERVLIRLQDKLKGMEEGTVLSVVGQVNFLIQQSVDPKNLSRLFPGWKPWLFQCDESSTTVVLQARQRHLFACKPCPFVVHRNVAWLPQRGSNTAFIFRMKAVRSCGRPRRICLLLGLVD